jgi:hypothetical protein
VYEFVEDEAMPASSACRSMQNCVHCKTCDIKDPTQNIVWVTAKAAAAPTTQVHPVRLALGAAGSSGCLHDKPAQPSCSAFFMGCFYATQAAQPTNCSSQKTLATATAANDLAMKIARPHRKSRVQKQTVHKRFTHRIKRGKNAHNTK